jgi:transposase
MSRKRAVYSPEFRDEMVKLFLEQEAVKSLAQVAREHGVGSETLRGWVKKHRMAHPDSEEQLSVSERARLRELEREVRELKLEKDFLGKAVGYFARECR